MVFASNNLKFFINLHYLEKIICKNTFKLYEKYLLFPVTMKHLKVSLYKQIYNTHIYIYIYYISI